MSSFCRSYASLCGRVWLAILLGHLKKDAAEVKKALLSLDEALLTPECLKQLIDFAPDDDEVATQPTNVKLLCEES